MLKTSPIASVWTYLVVAIMLTACDASRSQIEEPKPIINKADSWDKFIRNYEKSLETFFTANSIPGAAVAVVKGDSISYIKGFGVRQKGQHGKVDKQTLFRIGSLSKGFASVAAATLVEDGLLDWDDKLVDLVPGFTLKDSEQAQRITVRHILSHSTGLPRHTFTNLVEDGIPLTRIMAEFPEVDLVGQEGKAFRYQNASYALIELIVQAKTGLSYQEYITKTLFEPGGLSTASTDASSYENNPNHAMPHRRMPGKGYQPVRLNKKYYSAPAAGGINASITDMAEWLKIVLGKRPDVIRPASLDQLFEPLIETPRTEYYDTWNGVNKSSYGMGWRILDFEGRQIAYHGGLVNQFRCEIALDLENDTGICFLFNTQSFYARIAVPSFLHMLQMYLELKPEGS